MIFKSTESFFNLLSFTKETKEGIKMKKEEKFSADEVAKKYGVDLDDLRREQTKLARNLVIKDDVDFSKAERIGGVGCAFFGNTIVAAIVVMSKDFEVLEQQYAVEKAKFPYISGFRAYRELSPMLAAYEKLEQKPEVVFINGHGIAHPRLGLASHFSLAAAGVSTIGVADEMMKEGELKNGKIILDKKIVGEELKTKKESRPLYVSPGNMITVKSAAELAKKFVREPHKFPEPLHLAFKYAKNMRDELRGEGE